MTGKSYISEWVQPVKENIVWICQLPRSGGTLLLRLLDSHPQVHCYPAVFGFANENRIWPDQAEILDSTQVLDEIFSYMNLEKFHGVGLRKQSSNLPQQRYPIYFDGQWYREIFLEFLEGRQPRDYFNAFFTALFNAWRNNQNLYGPKKLVTGQMTLRKPELYRQNHENFRQVYPEGRMVFMARDPYDWLASALNLKHSTPFTQNPKEVMIYYKTIVRQAVAMAEEKGLILFRFEDLIEKPEPTMRWFAGQIGLDWNELLLSPTFNGAPFFQNSSFDIEQTAKIEASVKGRGQLLDQAAAAAVDEDILELYQRLLSFCPTLRKPLSRDE